MKTLTRIISVSLILLLTVTCRKHDSEDKTEPVQPQVATVSGSIIRNDFGTGKIYANTLLSQNSSLSDTTFSVVVSSVSAQLILLTTSDKKLKAFTFSYSLNNKMVVYPAGIESTGLSLMLITPGICTTKSDSLITRIAKMKTLKFFPSLKEYIKDNLSQNDLGQVCRQKPFQDILDSCISEFCGFQNRGKKAPGYDNDLYFSAKRTNGTTVEFRNNNFRFVKIYRQDLLQNGNEKQVTIVKEHMEGGTIFDYGQALHPLDIPATIEDDNTYSTVTPEVTKCIYWVCGMGFSPTTNQLPLSIARNTAWADLSTNVFYVIFPFLDFLGGFEGLHITLPAKSAFDFASCLKDQVTVVEALKTFQNSTSWSVCLETAVNLTMTLIDQGLTNGCFTKIGLPAAQDELFKSVLGIFGTAFGASNLIVWAKLIFWDTPSDSYYLILPLHAPQLLNPPNGSVTELTTDLSCYVYTGISSYRFQLSNDQNFTTSIINDLSDLPHYQLNLGTLVSGSTYYWRVRVTTNGGEISPWSDVWHFTASDAGAISKPVLLSPANNSANVSLTPVFDWDDVNNATLYSFQVDQNGTFSSPLIDKTNLTSSGYTAVSGILEQNKQYFWRARAYNSVSSSDWSDAWSFTTTGGTASNVILPLAVGNYWTYLPDITSQTVTISITGTIDIQGVTCYKWFAQGDQFEWYYRNKSDGCWAYGYSGPYQDPPDLEYKYPANTGNTWITNWIAVPVPTTMTCVSNNTGFASFSGCYKYHFFLPMSEDNYLTGLGKAALRVKFPGIKAATSTGYDVYQYFVPGIGMVGWENYFQGNLLYTVVMTDYHLH
ncbi:MAG: hypothetical protein WCK34_11325 [Bacteroidota bacterium]